MAEVKHIPVTEYEVTPQWQSFLDLEEDVKPWLQFYGIQLSPQQETQLQSITMMVCVWLQNYLARPIAPTKFKRLFSGWSGLNGSYLSLPYYPVIAVEKLGPPGNPAENSAVMVNEVWGTSGPHILAEETPESQGGSENFQLDPLRGLIIRSFQGLVQRPFFPGSRNIEVIWWAGYDPVQEDIKMAAKELIAHWWRNTQQATRTFALPGSEFGDSSTIGALWVGMPNRVKDLLLPYSQVGLG